MQTYNSWYQAIFNHMAVASTATINDATGGFFTQTDPIWSLELPLLIEQGEQRCYRDLDLLATRVTDTSGFASSGAREFSLPMSVGTSSRWNN